MINDLNANGVHLWKFLDDTTITEKVPKGTTSEIQLATDEIQDQSTELKFTLNEDKCKEMRVSFAKSVQLDISPVRINNKEIDLIYSAKILGLTIRNDLKWNDHVYSIVKKT
jgi:predicted extracellular nuclease